MIYYLLLLTIYIWPFGQLLTFSSQALPFTVYFLDVSVFLVFLSVLLSSKRKEILTGPVLKPLLIFLGIAVLSLLINLKQGLAAGLPLSLFYLLRLFIYPSLFFAAKHVGLARLKKPLIISICLFSILALSQYFLFPDMRFLKDLGFDDHYFRLIGSFYDPNFTGAIFAGLSLFFLSKNKYIYSAPFVGLLALTFSRASYLVFLVGLIYLLLKNKQIKLLLGALLLGLLVYLIPKPFGEGVNLLRTFSIFSRFTSWQEGLDLFLAKPLLGWGYNTLRGVGNSRFQIDNSFIYLLATTGVLGLLSFFNFLRQIYKRVLDQGIVVLTFSVLLHSLFNNSLFFIWISAFFWLSLGLGNTKNKN